MEIIGNFVCIKTLDEFKKGCTYTCKIYTESKLFFIFCSSTKLYTQFTLDTPNKKKKFYTHFITLTELRKRKLRKITKLTKQ